MYEQASGFLNIVSYTNRRYADKLVEGTGQHNHPTKSETELEINLLKFNQICAMRKATWKYEQEWQNDCCVTARPLGAFV